MEGVSPGWPVKETGECGLPGSEFGGGAGLISAGGAARGVMEISVVLARDLCKGIVSAVGDSGANSGEETSLDVSFTKVEGLGVVAEGVGDLSIRDGGGFSSFGVASTGEGKFCMTLKRSLFVRMAAL